MLLFCDDFQCLCVEWSANSLNSVSTLIVLDQKTRKVDYCGHKSPWAVRSCCLTNSSDFISVSQADGICVSAHLFSSILPPSLSPSFPQPFFLIAFILSFISPTPLPHVFPRCPLSLCNSRICTFFLFLPSVSLCFSFTLCICLLVPCSSFLWDFLVFTVIRYFSFSSFLIAPADKMSAEDGKVKEWK